MLVTALEANPEVPKIEVVTERLLHEEIKIKNKLQQNDDQENNALASKHRPVSGPVCWEYSEVGHVQRNCPKSRDADNNIKQFGGRDWDDNRQFAGETRYRENMKNGDGETQKYPMIRSKENAHIMLDTRGNYENDEYVALTTMDYRNEKKKQNWIIDSGATSHMCNDMNLFSDFKSLYKSQKVKLLLMLKEQVRLEWKW